MKKLFLVLIINFAVELFATADANASPTPPCPEALTALTDTSSKDLLERGLRTTNFAELKTRIFQELYLEGQLLFVSPIYIWAFVRALLTVDNKALSSSHWLKELTPLSMKQAFLRDENEKTLSNVLGRLKTSKSLQAKISGQVLLQLLSVNQYIGPQNLMAQAHEFGITNFDSFERVLKVLNQIEANSSAREGLLEIINENMERFLNYFENTHQQAIALASKTDGKTSSPNEENKISGNQVAAGLAGLAGGIVAITTLANPIIGAGIAVAPWVPRWWKASKSAAEKLLEKRRHSRLLERLEKNTASITFSTSTLARGQKSEVLLLDSQAAPQFSIDISALAAKETDSPSRVEVQFQDIGDIIGYGIEVIFAASEVTQDAQTHIREFESGHLKKELISALERFEKLPGEQKTLLQLNSILSSRPYLFAQSLVDVQKRLQAIRINAGVVKNMTDTRVIYLTRFLNGLPADSFEKLKEALKSKKENLKLARFQIVNLTRMLDNYSSLLQLRINLLERLALRIDPSPSDPHFGSGWEAALPTDTLRFLENLAASLKSSQEK